MSGTTFLGELFVDRTHEETLGKVLVAAEGGQYSVLKMCDFSLLKLGMVVMSYASNEINGALLRNMFFLCDEE